MLPDGGDGLSGDTLKPRAAAGGCTRARATSIAARTSSGLPSLPPVVTPISAPATPPARAVYRVARGVTRTALVCSRHTAIVSPSPRTGGLPSRTGRHCIGLVGHSLGLARRQDGANRHRPAADADRTLRDAARTRGDGTILSRDSRCRDGSGLDRDRPRTHRAVIPTRQSRQRKLVTVAGSARGQPGRGCGVARRSRAVHWS